MFGLKRRPRRRPALAGELCLCGNQAEAVIDDPEQFGPVFCTCLAKYEHPRHGPCPFCTQHLRDAVGADCPAYTLRAAWAMPAAQQALSGTASVRHTARES